MHVLTGRQDNVDFWTSQDVWDAALSGRHGVISTPQILLDALTHGFVSLSDTSLLVIDEAHHGNKKHPTNDTMQLFYHPLRARDPTSAPHILALTASPMNGDDLGLIQKLEQNLHAVCRSPTENIEEYRRYVHLPELTKVQYEESHGAFSTLLPILQSVVDNYNIEEDPQYRRLETDKTPSGIDKLETIKRRQATSILKQLKGLLNRASFMQSSLGAWATDHYISTCVAKAQSRVSDADEWLFTVDDEEKWHLQSTLKLIVSDDFLAELSPTPSPESMTQKVKVLAKHLQSTFVRGSACIVFVQRRSTAWALKEILDRMHSLDHIRFFTFVGATNLLRSELADLADRRFQDQAFAEFRAGQRDVALSTSVLEEGMDVQSCDSVICFDPPSNVRSHIQRRGRARQANSKLVLFVDSTDDINAKHAKWTALDAMMKDIYTSKKRRLEDLEAREAVVEACDRVKQVPCTNAVLTINNARQHLHHFCATLPQRTGRPETSPIYLLEATHGEQVFCKVLLPSSIPAELQNVSALLPWRTEAMAKNDAAFEAYWKLYEAGLVNDHLLPPVVEKSQQTERPRDEDSICNVPVAFNPWTPNRRELRTTKRLHAHRISTPKAEVGFPSMLLLLSTKLQHCNDCQLYLSSGRIETVCISSVDNYHVDIDLAAGITRFLFRSTLARRLPDLDSDDYHLPYYLVPDISSDHLQSWLNSAQETMPLRDLQPVSNTEYVLRRSQETVPYFYISTEADPLKQLADTVQATKLSKRLDMSQPPAQAVSSLQTLKVGDCIVSKIPPEYVKLMACIPTITHKVELALRAQEACTGPLKSIRLQSMKHVISALTAPGANGSDNFQRLEYLGDTLLKFHSTVNVFCNNPRMPESQLTFLENELVSNTRLQRITMDLGLDVYLATKAFSGHEWTLKERNDTNDMKRAVSSKTLADVVEAMIGVAQVEAYSPDSSDDSKVLRALSLFLPEVAWKPSSQEISQLPLLEGQIPPRGERLTHAQQILGYQFSNRLHLAEALTHSTVQAGIRSYERLEFLGDAVIDVIVKEQLFNSRHNFAEGEMHTRHIALVNKDIFAYIATKNGVSFEEKVVSTNLRTRQPEVDIKVRTKCLHDLVVKVSSEESGDQKGEFMARYEDARNEIEDALKEGTKYPWTQIYHLNAPKWCSDILESCLGAVFVDSGGYLDPCRRVLDKLGLMQIVTRAVDEKELDFLQPMRKVREVYPPVRMKVDVKRFARRDGAGGQWACRIKVDGEAVAVAMVKGCTCAAEAESRAAEVVLAGLKKEGAHGGERLEVEECQLKRKRDGEEDEEDEMDVDDD